MGYFGKILGGMAGFAVGGPLGAVVGAALGHAADSGVIPHVKLPFSAESGPASARVASMLGRRDQVFTIAVVALSAKLAKCDGPVNRMEINAFKRQFRVPSESVRDIGRLFDQARDSADRYEPYAVQLAQAFAEERSRLEQVLNALFVVARADEPVNARELAFLAGVHRHLGLDQAVWEQARGPNPRQPPSVKDDSDPYTILGVARSAKPEELRATWKRLMRENHPDSLAARGVAPTLIARASDKVAEINAAWDRIKRDRGL